MRLQLRRKPRSRFTAAPVRYFRFDGGQEPARHLLAFGPWPQPQALAGVGQVLPANYLLMMPAEPANGGIRGGEVCYHIGYLLYLRTRIAR